MRHQPNQLGFRLVLLSIGFCTTLVQASDPRTADELDAKIQSIYEKYKKDSGADRLSEASDDLLFLRFTLENAKEKKWTPSPETTKKLLDLIESNIRLPGRKKIWADLVRRSVNLVPLLGPQASRLKGTLVQALKQTGTLDIRAALMEALGSLDEDLGDDFKYLIDSATGGYSANFYLPSEQEKEVNERFQVAHRDKESDPTFVEERLDKRSTPHSQEVSVAGERFFAIPYSVKPQEKSIEALRKLGPYSTPHLLKALDSPYLQENEATFLKHLQSYFKTWSRLEIYWKDRQRVLKELGARYKISDPFFIVYDYLTQYLEEHHEVPSTQDSLQRQVDPKIVKWVEAKHKITNLEPLLKDYYTHIRQYPGYHSIDEAILNISKGLKDMRMALWQSLSPSALSNLKSEPNSKDILAGLAERADQCVTSQEKELALGTLHLSLTEILPEVELHINTKNATDPHQPLEIQTDALNALSKSVDEVSLDQHEPQIVSSFSDIIDRFRTTSDPRARTAYVSFLKKYYEKLLDTDKELKEASRRLKSRETIDQQRRDFDARWIDSLRISRDRILTDLKKAEVNNPTEKKGSSSENFADSISDLKRNLIQAEADLKKAEQETQKRAQQDSPAELQAQVERLQGRKKSLEHILTRLAEPSSQKDHHPGPLHPSSEPLRRFLIDNGLEGETLSPRRALVAEIFRHAADKPLETGFTWSVFGLDSDLDSKKIVESSLIGAILSTCQDLIETLKQETQSQRQYLNSVKADFLKSSKSGKILSETEWAQFVTLLSQPKLKEFPREALRPKVDDFAKNFQNLQKRRPNEAAELMKLLQQLSEVAYAVQLRRAKGEPDTEETAQLTRALALTKEKITKLGLSSQYLGVKEWAETLSCPQVLKPNTLQDEAAQWLAPRFPNAPVSSMLERVIPIASNIQSLEEMRRKTLWDCESYTSESPSTEGENATLQLTGASQKPESESPSSSKPLQNKTILQLRLQNLQTALRINRQRWQQMQYMQEAFGKFDND